jgi:hypothetical protein
VSPATITELLKFQPLCRGLFVFGRCVVAALTLCTFEGDDISHDFPGLLYYVGNGAGTNRSAALTDRKP